METTRTGIIIKCQANAKYRGNEVDVIVDFNVLIRYKVYIPAPLTAMR